MGLQIYEHLTHTGLLVQKPRYTVEIKTNTPQYYGWWCLEPEVLLRGIEVRVYFALKAEQEDADWFNGLESWKTIPLHFYDHKEHCEEIVCSTTIKNKIYADYKNSIKKRWLTQGY